MTVINSILASLFIPIFLAVLVYMLCVGLMSKAVLTRTPQYEKKSKFNKICIALSVCLSFLFVLKFGFTFELLKATLILAVFLFASVCDIKERKVEDYVPIMLLIIGFINVSPTVLFSRAMAFTISFALMFVIAIISNNKIGGADVKFMEFEMKAITLAERMYTYAQSQQISMQTGFIGYLRADLGPTGKEFFSTWNDFRKDLKTDEFKTEFDEVINTLRDDILKECAALSKYCNTHPENSYGKDALGNIREYGVTVRTDNYAYLIHNVTIFLFVKLQISNILILRDSCQRTQDNI